MIVQRDLVLESSSTTITMGERWCGDGQWARSCAVGNLAAIRGRECMSRRIRMYLKSPVSSGGLSASLTLELLNFIVVIIKRTNIIEVFITRRAVKRMFFVHMLVDLFSQCRISHRGLGIRSRVRLPHAAPNCFDVRRSCHSDHTPTP